MAGKVSKLTQSLLERKKDVKDIREIKRLRLEDVAEKLVEVFEKMTGNGSRGGNLCAPISFRYFETARLFKKVISSGKYPLEIAEGGINPMMDYIGESRKKVVVKYSIPVKYVKPQKNGNGGGIIEPLIA